MNNLSPGNYSVSVSDSNGCDTLATATVLALDNLIVTFDTTFETCRDSGSVKLQIESTVPPIKYKWDDLDSITLVNNINTVNLKLVKGIYPLGVKDAFGCFTSETITIDTLNWLYVNAGPDTTICKNESFVMQPKIHVGSKINLYDSLSWSPKENFINNKIFNAVTFKRPPDMNRVYFYDYVLTAYYGICTVSDDVTLTYYPDNGISLPDTITISRGSHEIVPIIGGNGSFVSYDWYSNNSNYPSENSRNLEINNLRDSIYYYFTGVTIYGCNETDSIKLVPTSEILPAGGFTPNGDGANDTWYIGNAENYSSNELTVEIFNRWGQKVFMQKGYTNGTMAWDGKYNGKPLPIGTYYYVITISGGYAPKKGTVTILKTSK